MSPSDLLNFWVALFIIKRVMQELRRRLAPQHAGEADLPARRVQQVGAPDHEVDRLLPVVNGDGELVGPVAAPIPDQQVAALGRGILHLGTEPEVVEALDAGIDPHPPAESRVERSPLIAATVSDASIRPTPTAAPATISARVQSQP